MKTSVRLVLLTAIAGLSGTPVTGGLARGVEDARQAACCTRCGHAESATMVATCGMCRDVWDWGPAYWRWGYSAGAWDAPSHKNWPALRTFSPRLDTSARSAWPGQTVGRAE